MAATLRITDNPQRWPSIICKDISGVELPSSQKRGGIVERIQLHDIRRQTTIESLVPCIIDGLKSECRESPPLLLWNDRGLSLFDEVLGSPEYYPAAREWTLLHTAVHKIAYSISSGDRLIELGAG